MTNEKIDAVVLVKKGNPFEAFELRKIDRPVLTDSQVMIESEAFGLNYADVMARNGQYREAPAMPSVIGYEVVGKIVEVGKNVSVDLIGTRVMAFSRFGGYAKLVCTEQDAFVPIEDMDAAVGLSLGTQSVTAFYMSRYITNIHPGENVLIHAAAGGVGTILIQLAKNAGATVYAKVGSDSKEELVRKLGADFVINYKKEDYDTSLIALLKNDRIDISYNAVGGSTFKKDLSLLGAGGRLVLFGGAELSGARFPFLATLKFLWKMGLILPIGLMMRSRNILGVNMLKIADNKPEVLSYCMQEVLRLYKNNIISPEIGGRYKVSEIAKAHDALEKGNTTGKLAIYW